MRKVAKSMVRVTVRMAKNNKLASTDDWGVGDHYLSIAGYHLDMYYRGDLASQNLERKIEGILVSASDRKVIHNRAFYGDRMVCVFWNTATDSDRLDLVKKLDKRIVSVQP